MKTASTLLLAFVAVAFVGCEKKPAPPTERPQPSASPEPKGPTGAPRPQPKLQVTLSGKPVQMATALAWKSWDGTIHVTASSVPVGCDDVTGDSREIHPGEVTFDVFAARGLRSDGTFEGEVRSTYFDGMNSQSTKAGALVGDGSEAVATTIEVDFETHSAADPDQVLAVKGTIDALGCKAPAKATPPMPPPMAATLEVAGKKLAVRSARWSAVGDGRSLELFTGSESCKQVPFEPPSELRVRFEWFKSDDLKVNQVDLNGALVSPKADQTFDRKKLTITPAPTGPGEVEIHGDLVVMDYPVKIDGKVTITECPK